MERAKRKIRDYLNNKGAKRVLSGDTYLWPGRRLFALSVMNDIRIVLRLEDRRRPYIGRMSIIVHSCHEPSHSINARIANTLRSFPDFIEEANRDRRANNEFGVVGRFYLPATYTWTRLDDATLKAIYDLYQRISGALFDAVLYV